MTRTIARSIALAALAAGACWAQSLTVTCTPATLPEVVGTSVSVTCTASGGLAPYTWGLAAGTLPPGLSQDPVSGNITGQLADPAVAYNFTVLATDSTTGTPLTGTQTYSGTTVDPVTVTCTNAKGPLEVGVLYTNSCTAGGGTPPYAWSIGGTNVPPGLTISSTGSISYTPTNPQPTYAFNVVATDSSTPVLKKPLPFGGTIAPAVTIATTSPLPPAAVGSLYSQQFAVTTGTGVAPYTWTATPLPTWLTMSTSGLLSGTPTSTSPVSFTATVTDSAGGTSSGLFSLTVNPALTISTTSPLPPATVGTAYSQTFGASGGSGTGYTWSVAGQPTWLGMSPGGILSGIPPSTAVTSAFQVKVTDSNNNSTAGIFALPVTLTITTASPLPAATIGTLYTQTLTAAGGSGIYSWSSKNLPSWLTLTSATGALSGTPPATALDLSFSVTVTDSSNATAPATLSLPVTLVITTQPPLPTATIGTLYSQTFAAEGGAGGYTWSATGLPTWLTMSTAGVLSGIPPATALDATFTAKVTDSASVTTPASFTVLVALSITTPSPLPTATVGTNYNQTFAASGGAGGYTWSATQLPAWATLSTAGVLTGIPTASGPVSFNVTVKDSSGVTATSPFTLTVNPQLAITTSSPLASGAIGATYNQTLTGTGGATPYTWAVTTGAASLPGGLTLAPTTGVIGGTPTTAGTFPFTIQLTDSSTPPNTTTKPFVISIGTGLTITTPSTLPNATVGIAYMQTLAAAGGMSPYSWSPVGPLPAPLAALSLSATGVIAGTPAAAATGTFPVTVTDSTGTTAKQNFTLAIVAPPVITTTSPLPNGTAGATYSQSLAASGGTPPYKWTVSSGSLPAGLSLSTAGAIAGTPNASGTFNFTVQLTDATGVTASKPFALTILTTLTISTASPLPTGELNIAYSQTLAATGGTPPYTWAVTVGSLPSGLALAANGSIAGKPSVAGNFNFTVAATDSNHVTATAAFALTVAGALGISTPPTLDAGSLNSSYSQSLVASAGVGPFTWTLAAGYLPPGLNLLASGTIGGLPTATGTFPFTAKVTDSLGATASRQFTIVVSAGLIISTPPSLPGGTVGIPYTEVLQASGGTAPYTWTDFAGTPPAGVSVMPNGDLRGVPIAAGSSSFTVQVTDSLGRQASELFTITVASALSVTTSALPAASVGATYSHALAASGGTPPYTWSILNGALPKGLALSAAGSITGTAAAAGTFSFTVKVTDSAAVSATKQLSIAVSGGLSIVTATALPNASLNVTYSQSLAAAGGTPPYTWTLTGGALPAGLSLSAAGALTGAPTAAGTFQFTATVTDSASGTASQQFTLIVTGLAITTTALPGGTVGMSYSEAVTASGGKPPYTFTVSAGSLPPGIKLSGAILSGTPIKSGSYTFTIQVTDFVSDTATEQFTIAIAGLSIATSALPAAAVGTSYSYTLAATGGTPPYSWSVVNGAPPAGLSLDASTGMIAGTPTAAATSSLTIQVTDSTNATASATFALNVIAASYTGLPGAASSAQQLSATLALGAAYPQQITGQVTLAFTPDPSLASPADDPSIQFSTGGTTASFTIAANSTAPFSFALQTGTVAGAITLTVTWQADGATLPSPAALTQTIQIAPAPPVVSSVGTGTTTTGFQVLIVAYSNTREVSQAILQFTPAAGQTLQTTSLTVSLTSAAATWFQSATSDQYGSQFVLTLPFTVSDGSASAIASVSVELVNGAGTSASASASF